MEEDRTPVGRLDFKSSEGRTTSLVGSTPTLFRQPLLFKKQNFDIVPFANRTHINRALCRHHPA